MQRKLYFTYGRKLIFELNFPHFLSYLDEIFLRKAYGQSRLLLSIFVKIGVGKGILYVGRK